MKQLQSTSSLRHRLLVILFMLTALATSFASPIALQERDIDVPNPQSGPFNLAQARWQLVALAVVCILTGLYFCLLGYRFFRVTIFVVGFWFFANIVYISLLTSGVKDQTTLFIASIAIGIFEGLILAMCYQIGVYLMGALAGYTFALWLLSFRAGGLIPSRAGLIIFVLVLVIVGVVLSYFFERFLIIVATSFLGAFLVIFGIELFVGTGYAAVVNGLLSGQLSLLTNESWQVYAMLAATFVLFLISLAFQFATSWRTIGREYNKGVPKYGVCAKLRGARNPDTVPSTRRSCWPWRKTTY